MNEIYQLSSWVNAVKIKNAISPEIKLDVTQIKDKGGYILTVYEDTQDETKDNILYRILVECSLANSWSMTTLEAIEFLNIIGFPCEWNEPEQTLSKDILMKLNSLYSLGWTSIVRDVRPVADIYIISSEKQMSLQNVLADYKYTDWLFLQARTIISIEALLIENKVIEPPIENTEEKEEIPTESE